MHKIITVQADKKWLSSFKKEIGEGFVFREFGDFEEALVCLSVENPDGLLLFLSEGETLPVGPLQQIKKIDDNLPVIVVTPPRTVSDAVVMMKAGVFDYFQEPLDSEKLKVALFNACKMYQLTKRIFLLENQVERKNKFDGMVGGSPTMQEVFQTIHLVAKTGATVLVLGESGTGKELVARAIHRHSPRVGRKFIDINCGAIPKELLENELFGHERGAFTGAERRYLGCCERADGGTLFLDEISEMDPVLQVKLLRFLQERSFTRVGGNEAIKVDVRIITATNKNLEKLVEQGKFREDLFYRLNVVPILISPLRERAEDIPLLAKHFLENFSQKNEKIFIDFSAEALQALMAYDWPGNVRELENTIERAVVLHNDTKVKLTHFPEMIQKSLKKEGLQPSIPSVLQPDGGSIVPLEVMERYLIESALRQCAGNVAEAARKLKIGQATMYRKIKQYGLRS